MSKLYRVPEEGMINGVCAGIARYTGINVTVVRLLAILALFFGAFVLTIIFYLVLSFILDEAPAKDAVFYSKFREKGFLSYQQALMKAEEELRDTEQRLREIERYITSDSYIIEKRFRNL